MAFFKTRKLGVLVSGLLIGLGMLVGSATAPAQPVDPDEPQAAPVDNAAPAICSLSHGWGGRFFCDSLYKHRLPNGHLQVFVIGTGHVAWTRWQSGSGLSDWKSLGGRCYFPGHDSIDLAWKNSANAWNFAIQCKDADYDVWRNQRYANGVWSGWYAV